MDIASLQNANIADLYAAADAYDTLTRAFTSHGTDWYTGTDKAAHGAGWTGQAADASLAALDATSDQLGAATTEIGLIARQLRESADAFQLAQSKLLKALQDAQAQQLSVNECGAVSWPPPPAGGSDDQAGWDAKQKPLADALDARITGALAEATKADEDLASMLGTFTDRANTRAGLDPTTAGADEYLANTFGSTPAYLNGVPGKDATPTQVNSWWNGLTPDEQQWFITQHPDLIGNRDGIPATVRDQVNRAYLQNTWGPLNEKVKKHEPLTPDEQDTYNKLNPIAQRLQEDHDHAGDGRPQDYLLGIGTEGQGRAIISFGNPDTATDISAYVPGMTSNPGSLGPGYGVTDGTNEAENALNTWRAAQAHEPPGHTAASIVWLGYDAPPIDPSGASTARADAGAPAYANFVTGLRTTNASGQCPHITSIGHSYGSLLVGEATRMSTQPGSPYTPPDDAVFIGSPGVGVDKASDLGLPPGHVWDGAAADDPITHLPSKGDVVAGAVAGPLGPVLTNTVDPHRLWYGRDPASSDFGANRFTVNDLGGETWNNPVGPHTKYLSPTIGGPSLNNIGNIVAGQYGNVQLEAGR